MTVQGARKRANGEGTVYQVSNGRWRATVSNGKKRVSTSAPTQAGAEAALVLSREKLAGIEQIPEWNISAETLAQLRQEARDARMDPSGWVYCILADEVNRCKIGYATDPVERFNTISAMSPVRLQLVSVSAGTLRLERAIHNSFAPLRWQGEWFLFIRGLRDFVLDDMERFRGKAK